MGIFGFVHHATTHVTEYTIQIIQLFLFRFPFYSFLFFPFRFYSIVSKRCSVSHQLQHYFLFQKLVIFGAIFCLLPLLLPIRTTANVPVVHREFDVRYRIILPHGGR